MILKSHLCGVAVAYDNWEREPADDAKQAALLMNESLKIGRPQGSLYSQQKYKIANACEWMRLNATNKPIIFVATSPGFTDHASERQLISKLTHNLRNGYSCKNYVWVREFTGNGYPHFHFVADMPRFDAVGLSLYWSGLFGVDATNSIRLGTAPPKRRYFLTSKSMSWYMTKYLGKSIGSSERGAVEGVRSFRTFAVSNELAKASEPQMFTGKWERIKTEIKEIPTITGIKQIEFPTDARVWRNCTAIMSDKDVQKKWQWKYTGFSSTFKGYPKEWKLKPKKVQQVEAIPPEIVCPF